MEETIGRAETMVIRLRRVALWDIILSRISAWVGGDDDAGERLHKCFSYNVRWPVQATIAPWVFNT